MRTPNTLQIFVFCEPSQLRELERTANPSAPTNSRRAGPGPDDGWSRTSGHDASVNRLADETSPYLRQHADNPVDWYPWGD